jgi:hypothetical protein
MTYPSAKRIVLNILAPIVICVFAAGCNSAAGGDGQAAAALPQSAGTGSKTLNCVAPVSNSDGTTLTNLAGYYIHYSSDRKRDPRSDSGPDRLRDRKPAHGFLLLLDHKLKRC